MGRKSPYGLLPGIQRDKNGVYWATLEGEDAKLWRKRYPGKSLPRRKAKDQKAASIAQRRLSEDLKNGRDPNAKNPKVADWVRTCIERKRDLETSTATRYRSSLTWQIEPHPIGRMRLQQVMKRQVEEWVSILVIQKHQRYHDRTLDPYSIRNAFALLRMALNMAIDEEMITKNPCKGVKLPKPNDEEIQPLTPEQVGALFDLIDTLIEDKATHERRPHRNAALYHVATRCGLREGELRGLRWVDVDLKRRELHVRGQFEEEGRKDAKYSSHRTVPLSVDIVQVLTWHKKNQAEERALIGSHWNEAQLVFVSENGTPLNPSNMNSQLNRFLAKLKVSPIRFHDLRHTYAALNIAAGVDLYTLSRRMGHKSITVTADKYGHLYKGHAQDADALDRLLQRSA